MGLTSGRRGVEISELAAAAGGAALLTASWVVVATRDDVPAAEAKAFVAVNELPDAVWTVVWAPMQVGSLGGSLLVVAATAVVSRRRGLTGAALLASQGAYWTAKVVKRLASRERPEQLLPMVKVRERTTGLGYLSGHSAVAFALATVIAAEVPRPWRTLPFAVATGVGLGRVYAGAHLPLDVVGGVGLGILTGIGSRWVLGIGGAGLPSRRGDVSMAR
jgi:undecaprenyl-diphosphatase